MLYEAEGVRAMVAAFGLVVVTSMLVFYALEARSSWSNFAFGLACLASSAYGWLARTWPFGLVEMVWALVAFRRWHGARQREANS